MSTKPNPDVQALLDEAQQIIRDAVPEPEPTAAPSPRRSTRPLAAADVLPDLRAAASTDTEDDTAAPEAARRPPLWLLILAGALIGAVVLGLLSLFGGTAPSAPAAPLSAPTQATPVRVATQGAAAAPAMPTPAAATVAYWTAPEGQPGAVQLGQLAPGTAIMICGTCGRFGAEWVQIQAPFVDGTPWARVQDLPAGTLDAGTFAALADLAPPPTPQPPVYVPQPVYVPVEQVPAAAPVVAPAEQPAVPTPRPTLTLREANPNLMDIIEVTGVPPSQDVIDISAGARATRTAAGSLGHKARPTEGTP